MTTTKLLARLAAVAPAIIAANAKPGARCVFATRIGVDVLAAFGKSATPIPVLVDVANRAYFAWATAGGPGGPDEFRRRGCWVLSNDYPPADVPIAGQPSEAVPIPVASQWRGHLVFVVGGTLVDLDAQQFARPRHGMTPPPAIVAPWDGGVAGIEFPWGGVRYRPWPADRPLTDYRTAGDWTGGPWVDIVAAVVRAIGRA